MIDLIDHKEVYKIVKGNLFKDFPENFSQFSFEYLHTLIEPIKNKINVRMNIKYTVFIDVLIKFYLMPRTIKHSLNSIANELKTDIQIVEFILGKFTVKQIDSQGNTKYFKTPDMNLKLIYHIVILALDLNDYKMNADPLCKSLQIENKIMLNYLKQINCTFPGVKSEIDEISNRKVKKINKLLVELRAPLKFNDPSKKYQKRNK